MTIDKPIKQLLIILLFGSSICFASTASLIDATTAMFYHMAHTKSCGTNLQTLKIDLTPMWNVKLKPQISKAMDAAKFFNNYLNKLEGSESRAVSNDVLYYELSRSGLVESLSHFIFSSSPPVDRADLATQSLSTDPYIIGYGLVLDSSSSAKMSCIYVGKNDQAEQDARSSNSSCRLLNQGVTPSQPGVQLTYGFTSNGNHDSAELNQNCCDWFQDIKSAFNQFTQQSYSSRLDRDDHEQRLNEFVKNERFSPSSWCGPFYDCSRDAGGVPLNSWILTFSLPLFDSRGRFRGAVAIKLVLDQMDVNQCDDGDPVFKGTHKCKPNSQCVFMPGTKFKFKSGNYKCKCSLGFVNKKGLLVSYEGDELERQYWLMKSMKNSSYQTEFNCLPCQGPDCCDEGNSQTDTMLAGVKSEKLIENEQAELLRHCRRFNMPLRLTFLFVQITFIMICLSFAVIVFATRQNKFIKHSMWILLELMLVGAVLLYLTPLLRLLEPSPFTCIAIPWSRELGFTIVYGILNLRLYKILVEFQSRKAHCVQFKEKDILRNLFFLVLCVFGYLVAWTLVDLDYMSEGFSMTQETSLRSLVQYSMCRIKWWDYFVEMAEFSFIGVGFYLLYCTRTAPSHFNERKFISIVMCAEGLVSTLVHVIKHSISPSLHPDTMLIIYFIRCHSTVTLMLFFIFVTKLFVLFRPDAADYYGPSMRQIPVDLQEPSASVESAKLTAGNSNNTNNTSNQGQTGPDPDLADINLRDMQPDEIRSELRRLYTQLHVYRIKSVKTDNPHIQQKRKVKKARRFSIAKSQSNRDAESNHARTPDESFCSAEANMQMMGVSFVDEK
nr:G protein-coupled receptor [Proales similis]